MAAEQYNRFSPHSSLGYLPLGSEAVTDLAQRAGGTHHTAWNLVWKSLRVWTCEWGQVTGAIQDIQIKEG